MADQQQPPMTYNCTTCQKTYKYKSGLDKHNATKHQLGHQQPQATQTNLPHQQQQQQQPLNPATNTQPELAPFLKWVGGKTQILREVISRFPRKITNYYEPFLGGGSVLFGLLNAIAKREIQLDGHIYVSDLNPGLIATYNNIKTVPEQVIQETAQLIQGYKACPVMNAATKNTAPQTLAEAQLSQENYYYWCRKLYNSMTPAEKQTPQGSAKFIFINKTCFRGLFREGPNGVNVPFGNYGNPSILDPEQIRQISAAIQRVEFTVSPYQTQLGKARAGDFIYLDPPYVPENATSFVGYNADGFKPENHTELFKMCRDLTTSSGGNIRLMMSNSDVPIVKDQFPAAQGFTTNIIVCKRRINSKNPRATTNEVIITNY